MRQPIGRARWQGGTYPKAKSMCPPPRAMPGPKDKSRVQGREVPPSRGPEQARAHKRGGLGGCNIATVRQLRLYVLRSGVFWVDPKKERGPALAGWPSLKRRRLRAAPRRLHLYCTTTVCCCQGLRCSFLDADALPVCLVPHPRGCAPALGRAGGWGCYFAVAARFCGAERKKPLTAWRGCGMVKLSVVFR